MNRLLQYITPDWQITWDSKQIAEELPGFVFRGAGWYHRENSWLLIINTDTPDVYTLQAFFDRDPRRGFEALVDAPVRVEVVETNKQPFQYGGLIVLVIGLFILLPLSGFLLHKFGFPWGTMMLLSFAFLWGQLARRFSKNRVEKKT